MSTFPAGNQDVDVTDFDDPTPWPTRTSFRQAVDQVATKARATLPECSSRVDSAVKLILAGDVELLPDGTAQVLSATEAGTAYHVVNGACFCRDFPQAPHAFCKHRLAVGILRRSQALLETPAPAPEPLTTPAVETHADIPAQFIVELHGKKFVQYAGLLALAHQRGLVSLTATFISVTAELALAQATAVFSDGRTFTEAADATPTNVGPKVKAHYARMALTRAKARTLRDALNISMCSLEELDSE